MSDSAKGTAAIAYVLSVLLVFIGCLGLAFLFYVVFSLGEP